MVLINNLTIDEINAALLHLQRSQGEVVGGEKGTAIQNISLRNEGGTSGTDYSDAISKINETLDEHEKELGEMGVTDAKMQTQLDRLASTIENLSTSGINSVSFDDDTRTLSIELTDGQVYEVEIPEDSISLEFDANTNQLILSYGDVESKVTLPYINTNKLGVANGVATLDSSGRVPYSQLPESAMEFKGEWNASTNTPQLADGSGTNGDFYICTTAGTVTFGTGNTQTFMVNDRVLYNGATSKWIKLPAGQVTSVNSMTGDVVVDANNINYNNNTTVKQAIDSKANASDVVQSDWTQTNSSQKDFIKHKIPIWITSGSADDNMSPIDSVTDGSSRPITSNAVFDVLNPLAVSKGGTGVKTQANINKAIIAALSAGTSDVTDGTEFVSSYASDNGFSDTNAVNVPYKRKFSTVWNYIKGKISSILGLTASTYGGSASAVNNYHADIESGLNLMRVIRGSNNGATSPGYWAAMSQINADGSTKWWHILNMDWSGASDNPANWVSQLLLPTQQEGVPKYRRNNAGGTAIGSSTWHNFITDENVSSTTVGNSSKLANKSEYAPSSQDLSEHTDYWASVVKSKLNPTTISYLILSNGLKIYWGQTSVSTALQTITLPTGHSFYDRTSYSVFLTREKTSNITSGGGTDKTPQVYKVNDTSFKIDQYSNASYRTMWIALGF